MRTSQRCQASISHSAIRFALLGPTERRTDDGGSERPGCVASTRPPAKFRNEKSSGNDNDTRALSSLSSLRHASRSDTSKSPNHSDSSLCLRKSLGRAILLGPTSTVLFTREGELVRRLYREKRQSYRPSVRDKRTSERTSQRRGQAVRRPFHTLQAPSILASVPLSPSLHRGLEWNRLPFVRKSSRVSVPRVLPRVASCGHIHNETGNSQTRRDDCGFVWRGEGRQPGVGSHP